MYGYVDFFHLNSHTTGIQTFKKHSYLHPRSCPSCLSVPSLFSPRGRWYPHFSPQRSNLLVPKLGYSGKQILRARLAFRKFIRESLWDQRLREEEREKGSGIGQREEWSCNSVLVETSFDPVWRSGKALRDVPCCTRDRHLCHRVDQCFAA